MKKTPPTKTPTKSSPRAAATSPRSAAMAEAAARQRRADAAELGIDLSAAETGGKNTSRSKAKTATCTAAAPKAPTAPTAAKPRRLSLLSAAAKVLAESKEPMRTTQMLEAITKRGLWKSPKGKTPEASLYAAVIREIAAKDKNARFRKTGPGLFAATAAAKRN